MSLDSAWVHGTTSNPSVDEKLSCYRLRRHLRTYEMNSNPSRALQILGLGDLSGKGFRAQVVNLTGEKEGDRIADFEAARKRTEAAGKLEVALLSKFGMKKADWHYWNQLVDLPPEKLTATVEVAIKKTRTPLDRGCRTW